jgi:hypothetical protein
MFLQIERRVQISNSLHVSLGRLTLNLDRTMTFAISFHRRRAKVRFSHLFHSVAGRVPAPREISIGERDACNVTSDIDAHREWCRAAKKRSA